MKKVAIYVRVSTTRQDQEGYSIPLQKERLIAYCKAKGWIVAGMFVDPGHSGASLERPGMTALIDGVQAGKFDVVLVYKLDRLSRSQRDIIFLLEDVFEPNSTAFVSMQESFDTTTIYGRAMLSILSVFAQMERETIAERTLMGRSGRAEDGLWHGGGTAPLGYEYIDGELVVNPEEARQIRAIYNLYASGFSVTDICRRMDGQRTKYGDWSHTGTVGNVLDNPLYAGVVHFDGVEAKGRHDAIIPPDINQKVKLRRDRLRRLSAAQDSDYLLTGLVRCASCGARYCAHKRPNGRAVYSCHSRAKKNRKMIKDPGCKAPHIPVSDLDAMVEAEVLRLAENPAEIDVMVKKRTADEGSSGAVTRSEEIQRLDSEIARLMDLYQHDDLVSVEEIAVQIAEAHSKRIRLAPVVKRGKSYSVEAAKVVFGDIRHGWREMNSRSRRAYLLQLIDSIHIDARGDLNIVWSF